MKNNGLCIRPGILLITTVFTLLAIWSILPSSTPIQAQEDSSLGEVQAITLEDARNRVGITDWHEVLPQNVWDKWECWVGAHLRYTHAST
jgi:hypothetical protein